MLPKASARRARSLPVREAEEQVIEITRTRHDESSEPDADGMVEWAYSFELFVFEEGGQSLTFRRYLEIPGDAENASLLRRPSWKELAGHADFLAEALRHLCRVEGVTVFSTLDEHGYVPLEEAIVATPSLTAVERRRLLDAWDRRRA
jgi:hypothetical protein